MKRNTAFSLQELLVVMFIITALVGIIAPSVGAAREMTRRASCRMNLAAIGKALLMYRNENRYSYPFLMNDCNIGMIWTGGGTNDTGGTPDKLATATKNIYSIHGDPSKPTSLNMLDNLHLLMGSDVSVPGGKIQNPSYLQYKTFLCPSVSNREMRRDANSRYGWRDPKTGGVYIHYAYHIGYTKVTQGINLAPLVHSMDSGIAIMADRPIYDSFPSPVKSQVDEFRANPLKLKANAQNPGAGWNHRDSGVNVLYAGGEVRWSERSIMAGWRNNNLYRLDMDGAFGNIKPRVLVATETINQEWRYDSVLFYPTRPPNP